MIKNFIYTTIFVSFFGVGLFAQTPRKSPTPSSSPKPSETPVNVITGGGEQLPKTDNFSMLLKSQPASIETILAEAEKQTVVYRENFNVLLAEETKTFEEYKKDGSVKNSRVVESNFLVYQSANNPGSIVEYRNVTKVDGKIVGNSEKRAEDFFEKVLKSSSAEQELKKIQEESSRYDKSLDIAGMTLNQAPVLAAHIRPAFEFRVIGEDKINDSEVFIVSYQQKTQSPYLIFNDDKKKPDELWIGFDVNISGSIKEPNPLLRGKLWIDKQSMQVLREFRELTVQPPGVNKTLVAIEMNLEYQKTNLEILTPKKITFTVYAIKAKDKGREVAALKENKVIFDYTKFTKSDVEVKSGDAKN